MKKTMLVIMLFLLTAGICYAQNYDDYGYRDNDGPGAAIRHKYNPMEDRWETVQGEKS